MHLASGLGEGPGEWREGKRYRMWCRWVWQDLVTDATRGGEEWQVMPELPAGAFGHFLPRKGTRKNYWFRWGGDEFLPDEGRSSLINVIPCPSSYGLQQGGPEDQDIVGPRSLLRTSIHPERLGTQRTDPRRKSWFLSVLLWTDILSSVCFTYFKKTFGAFTFFILLYFLLYLFWFA